MTNHTSIFTYLSLFFLLCCLSSLGNAAEKALPAESTATVGKAVWTWADKSGSGHAIFISRQAGNSWEKPIQVSSGEGVNVVPAVLRTSGEDLMIVWSNYTGTEAQLRYRQLKNGQWTEEKEYYTGLPSNMAPSVCVDGKGTTWLVWIGYNGISDEIYYSTWNGTSFAPPTALTANDVPDIQPVLGIDEVSGTPFVQWLQYSEKGYVKYESAWNGSAWGQPLLVSAAKASADAEETTSTKSAVVIKKAGKNAAESAAVSNQQAEASNNQMQIEIPDFITIPESASLHIPGYAVQSLPVRSVATSK